MRSSKFFLFVYILPFLCQGQDAYNFEFLDHDPRSSILMKGVSAGDDFFYIAVHDNGHSSITMVNNICEKNVIFSTIQYPQSRIIKNEDNGIDFLLFNLFEYDIFLPGFFHINYQDGETAIKDYVFNDSIGYVYPTDMIIDSAGNYIVLEDKMIKIYDDLTLVNTLESIIPFTKMFENGDGDIFLYSDLHISHLDGNALVTKLVSNDDINGLYLLPDNNVAVAYDNWFGVYSNQFQTMEYEITSPVELRPDNVQLFDSTLYVVSRVGDLTSVYALDKDEDHTLIFSEDIESETATYLFKNESDSLFISGYYENSVSANIYIRDLNPDPAESFLRVDLALDSFRLEHTHSISSGMNKEYFYTYTFHVRNAGNNPVNFFNVYSDNYFFVFDYEMFLSVAIDSLLLPGESFMIQDSFSQFAYPFQSLTAFIPGADFKFDSDMSNNFLEADFTSSVSNSLPAPELNIFPNPVSEILHINSPEHISSLEVFDVNGRIHLKHAQFHHDALSVESLSSGIYFLHMETIHGLSYVHKFIRL